MVYSRQVPHRHSAAAVRTGGRSSHVAQAPSVRQAAANAACATTLEDYIRSTGGVRVTGTASQAWYVLARQAGSDAQEQCAEAAAAPRSGSARPGWPRPEGDVQRAIGRKLARAATAEELLGVVCAHGTRFGASTCALAYAQLARLLRFEGEEQRSAAEGDPRLSQLALLAAQRAPRMSGVQAATVATACAWLAHTPPHGLLGRLEGALLVALSSAAPDDVCHALWALSRLGHPAQRLLQASAHAGVTDGWVHQLPGKPLASLLWAHARAAAAGAAAPALPPLLDAVLHNLSAPAFLATLTPQELSQVLWSLARLRRSGHLTHVPCQLLALLAGAAERGVVQFTPQGVAVTCWALAQLAASGAGALPAGLADATSSLYAVFGDAAAQRLEFYRPQEVANLLGAFALRGVRHPALAAAAEQYVTGRSHLLGRRDLVNLLLAFVRLPWQPGSGVLAALEHRAVHHAASLSPYQLCTAVWALERLGRRPAALLAAAVPRRERLAGAMSAADAGRLLWACGACGGSACAGPLAPWVAAASEALGRQVAACGARDAAAALSSLARAGGRARDPLARALCERVAALQSQLSGRDAASVAHAIAKLGAAASALRPSCLASTALEVALQAASQGQLSLQSAAMLVRAAPRLALPLSAGQAALLTAVAARHVDLAPAWALVMLAQGAAGLAKWAAPEEGSPPEQRRQQQLGLLHSPVQRDKQGALQQQGAAGQAEWRSLLRSLTERLHLALAATLRHGPRLAPSDAAAADGGALAGSRRPNEGRDLRLSVSELVTVAVAAAQLRLQDPLLADSIAEAALQLLDSRLLDPTPSALLLWALGRMGLPLAPDAVDAFARAMDAGVAQPATPRSLGACGAAAPAPQLDAPGEREGRAGGHPGARRAARRRRVRSAGGSHSGGPAPPGQPLDADLLVLALSGFADQGYQPTDSFLRAVCERLRPTLAQLHTHRLCELLTALAVLQRPEHGLPRVAADELAQRVAAAQHRAAAPTARQHAVGCAHSVHLLWALLALDACPPALCRALAARAFSTPAAQLQRRPLLLRRLLECKALLQAERRRVWRPLSAKWLALRSAGTPAALDADLRRWWGGGRVGQAATAPDVRTAKAAVLAAVQATSLPGVQAKWLGLGNGDEYCLVSWRAPQVSAGGGTAAATAAAPAAAAVDAPPQPRARRGASADAVARSALGSGSRRQVALCLSDELRMSSNAAHPLAAAAIHARLVRAQCGGCRALFMPLHTWVGSEGGGLDAKVLEQALAAAAL